MEEQKTLYHFKLDEETGTVTKTTIPTYDIRPSGNIRYKNNRVVSFDGNINHAVDIIYKKLMSKRDIDENKYKRYQAAMEKLAGNYYNNLEVAT